MAREKITLGKRQLKTIVRAANRVPVEKWPDSAARIRWTQTLAALHEKESAVDSEIERLRIIHKAPGGGAESLDFKDAKAFTEDLEKLLEGTIGVHMRRFSQKMLEHMLDYTPSPIKTSTEALVPPVPASIVADLLPLFDYVGTDEDEAEAEKIVETVA